MKIVLAPHNDDETLFTAYTCQRYKPYVVVCLRSFVQESRGGPTYSVREAETAEAMQILGCNWEQWLIPDMRPDWTLVQKKMLDLDDIFSPDEVLAPAFDFEGNDWPNDGSVTGFGLYHHDMIGMIAERVFGERTSFYQTYSRYRGKVESGVEVIPAPEEIIGKLTALSRYQSQIAEPSTRAHFTGSMREFIR